jgi:hypothetical protein
LVQLCNKFGVTFTFFPKEVEFALFVTEMSSQINYQVQNTTSPTRFPEHPYDYILWCIDPLLREISRRMRTAVAMQQVDKQMVVSEQQLDKHVPQKR